MTTHDQQPGETRRSGRVRIIGAEPAGGPAPEDGEQAPAGAHEPEDAGGAPTGTELPHWTEAPTGEVPAVLARDPEEGASEGADPWSTLPAPTWREEHADWTADEGTFEPSMLAHNEARLGSLDDSGESDRQPWSFELPGHHDPEQDTMVVPVVGRPLAAEEPGEVAFRFDEVDEEHPPGAVPSEVRGGTTTMPRVEPEPEATAASPQADVAPAPAPPAPTPTPAPADEVPDDEDDDGRRGRRAGRGAAHRRRPVPEAPVEGEAPRPAGRPVPPAPPAPRRPPPPPPGLRPPEPPRETRSGRDLPVAVASGLVLGVVALIFFKLGTVTSMIVATGVVTLAAVEAYAAFRKAGYHPATLLGLVATVSLMVATYNKGQEALPLVLVMVVAFTMLWHLAGVDRAAEPVRSTASTLLVFCWVAVFGSFAALLLDPTLFPDRHGIAFLLGAVVTGVAYDVGALGVGAWIGRHPLSGVSPNKTWEGLAGGGVASILAGVIVVHFVHPWTLGSALALGVVVAVVSPIGDLSESLVKRHLGLKDMGRILPGHGGFLDRVDGLLFVLPATYYLVKAFNLG